jgi:NAD(P)-dependent dehydrogenase (short-subunit alcohol dehydrogenase family)
MSERIKVAVITGAGSGIGRASAIALHRENFCVVLAGRRESELNETARLARAQHSHPSRNDSTLAVPTDVTDPASIKNLFEKARQAFGRVDVLFNNAGRGTPATPMEDLPLDQFLAVVNTNLVGCFLCAQEAIRIMKSQSPKGGRIINNGSISAQVPRPHSVAYTTTKHAITGLTKCIALDGRAHDITASQIDIGNANTAMGGRMQAGVPQANGTILAEAVFDVEHVARAIVYIATLPLDVNVLSMNVMATKMPFVGRG